MAFNFKAVANRRRVGMQGAATGQVGSKIVPSIQRERVTEFGKPQGGNPMTTNPATGKQFTGQGASAGDLSSSKKLSTATVAGAVARRRKALSEAQTGGVPRKK